MPKRGKIRVGQYLVRRLEQLGLGHVFGVPGDYILELFKYLEDSKLDLVCNCNELNAGYAADAYARVRGLGAVCVTYGVGAFSIFNAVVGAQAERIPMVVISGAPKSYERLHHHLLHHTTGDMNLQFSMYERVTAASCVITNAQDAPAKIDRTLEACLRFKRPVYIELPIDIVTMMCPQPGPFKIDTEIRSNRESLNEAVREAADLLSKSKNPVILAGIESHRLGAQAQLKALIEKSGFGFASTLLGKSVISEDHPQFIGVYGGVASWDSAAKFVGKADMILCLGTIMTDIHLGGSRPLLANERMILANSDKVRIKNHTYENISLKDFMSALKARLKRRKGRKISRLCQSCSRVDHRPFPMPGRKITAKRFYKRIENFIGRKSIVIGETGDSIFNVAGMILPKGVMCIDQAFYLSIGYAVPATLGASIADRSRRVMSFIGDGAFQMTAQEISTIVREKLNPVIFLMNNDGYTIERVMVDGAFNDLQMWDYSKLPGVFKGGWGAVVNTEEDLEEALDRIDQRQGEFAIVEIRLDRWDASDGILRYGENYRREHRKR